MAIELILTHPGGSHKDEFLACCLLAARHGVPIVRREPEQTDLDDPNVLVVDVGGEHEPARGNFDHHQFPRDHAPICALSLVLQDLGLYEDAEIPGDRSTLEPGDTLLLYTDGVTEAFNPEGREFSQLGLLEMTRQRLHESLSESVYDPCPYCKGFARVKSTMTMSVEMQRKVHVIMQKARETEARHELLIVVHPEVLDRLRKEDAQHLVELERRYEARLTFRGDPNYHREQMLIADPDTGKEIKV